MNNLHKKWKETPLTLQVQQISQENETIKSTEDVLFSSVCVINSSRQLTMEDKDAILKKETQETKEEITNQNIGKKNKTKQKRNKK